MSKYKIKIVDSVQKIENNILRAFETDFKQSLRAAVPRIQSNVVELVKDKLRVCPEIISIRSGVLKFDFGIGDDVTEPLIAAIADSVYVYFRNIRINKKATNAILSIYIQRSDFVNIIQNAYGVTITEKGENIPWLEWLLLGGDAVLLVGYRVSYGLYDESRSGGAIMVPGGFYKIPSEYSGTPADNFITRALENSQEEIYDIVRRSI